MKFNVEDLIGRFALISVTMFFIIFGLYHLQILLSDPWSYETWLLDLVVRSAGLLFMLLIVATTLIRLPAKNTAAGLEPRISAMAGSFFALTLIVLPRGEITAEARIVALALILAGTGLSVYCLYWLGRSFSVMAHARKLVTVGPYSIVRHPLYAAEAISLFGIALANFSPLAAVVMAITIAFQFRRMANEERVLRATFTEYEDYAKRVPMIIPMIGRRRIAVSE